MRAFKKESLTILGHLRPCFFQVTIGGCSGDFFYLFSTHAETEKNLFYFIIRHRRGEGVMGGLTNVTFLRGGLICKK